MAGIAYVNGQFVPHAHAQVAMEDRGYQFADGIYEVMAFYNRRKLNAQLHLERMTQSLKELRIPMPMHPHALMLVIDELIARNHREHGIIYMQVTRGVATRGHVYSQAMKPVLTMAVMPAKIPAKAKREKGVRVIVVEDQRWKRCDIKSIALLPNTIARQAAAEDGAFEAWQVHDGQVTEGSLSNAYIVRNDGVVQTHPADHGILGGVTRSLTLKFAKENGIKVEEKRFTLDDVAHANEAFLTSCTSNVLPIYQVGEHNIGKGDVGPVTRQLMQAYESHIAKETGYVFT